MCKIRECCAFIRRFCKEYVTVEPVLFFYLLAIFMEISITYDLLSTKNCLTFTNVTNISQCSDLTKDDRKIVKTETSKWISYNGACLFAFTMLSASYIGSWSDKFSRKYTMIIPPIGSVFATIFSILNGYYIDWPISLTLISSVLSGISGGIMAIIASSFGYLADKTTTEQRTKRIVVLEAMIFLGGTLGMLAGGGINKFVKNNHPELNSYAIVFGFEIILVVFVAFYIVIRIKENQNFEAIDESLSQEPQQRSLCYRLFSLSHIKDSIKMVIKPRNEKRRMAILLLMLISFLSFFSISIQTAILFSYLSAGPLRYDQTQYSYYQGACFGVSGLALIIGLPIAFQFLHVKDTSLAILGEISKMLGLILLGFSETKTELYLCAFLFLFSEYPIPAIRSILSKIVEPDEKGKIFAFMQLLSNFCMLISSQIFNWLFVVTYDVFPGVGFEIVAGLQLIAILLLIYLHLKFKINSSPDGSLPYDRLPISNTPGYETSLPSVT